MYDYDRRTAGAPAEVLHIELSAAPNPDFLDENPELQDPKATLSIPKKLVRVKSLSEASAVARRFIYQNGLGGGNWTGGKVYDQHGKLVAYVSFNGRVWDSDRYPGAKEIKI
jgi:hypothetical protein